MSDKGELKLAAEVWDDLGQPRDNPLTDSQQEILEQEAFYSLLRSKMLSFFAVQEHSTLELRRKLLQCFFKIARSDVSALVERCFLEMQELDFQSDKRFARCLTESKLANKQHVPFKILHDLQNLGISREQVQEVLIEYGDQGFWLKKAFDCWCACKKIKEYKPP